MTESPERAAGQGPEGPRVALFATCLMDLFRPGVGFAAVRLLEAAGCRVEVPGPQSCCGQPAFNSGDEEHAREIACRLIELLEPYDYVVAPSGSCIGMIRVHFPELFGTDAGWLARAQGLAGRCHELTSFLVDVMEWDRVQARFDGAVTYHDTCSGLRELGVRAQPRRLLAAVEGLELREMEDTDVCCGFGGTFCVKYPEISTRMVSDKIDSAARTGAGTLLGGDLGCLLNIAGRLRRQGSAMKVYHVAEVLADMADGPAIGQGSNGGKGGGRQ